MEKIGYRDSFAVALVILIAGLVVLLSGPPAEAHYLSTSWRFTYKTGGYCTKNYDELSHNSTYQGGTYQSAVEIWYVNQNPWSTTDCLAHESAIQRAQVRTWRWTGSTWYICADSGVRQFQATFRSVVWLRYSHTPCGPGYYTSDGAGWNYINGAWKGGWVALWDYSSTWYHWLFTS